MKEHRNIQKKDGFENERLFVMPEDFLKGIIHDPLFFALYVTDIGYFPHALHHFRERSMGTPTWVMMYCINGEGVVQLEDQEPYQLQKGQVTFLPANVPHLYYASEEQPWSLYWVHFNGTLPRAVLNASRMQGALHLLSAGCALLEPLFAESFQLLKGKHGKNDYFYLCQIVSHMIGIVYHFVTDANISGKGEAAVQMAIAFMKQNLHRSITLEELASATYYSPSYLLQLFQRITQSSPMAYFQHMKIQAASKEVYFTKRPIKEIAQSYGFADSLYFSRVFKSIIGVSPKAYRNKDNA